MEAERWSDLVVSLGEGLYLGFSNSSAPWSGGTMATPPWWRWGRATGRSPRRPGHPECRASGIRQLTCKSRDAARRMSCALCSGASRFFNSL